tara:strand:+ start:293 stop:1675 length:1383 start_codon:yes stop_codon:yes gene_type:complete
MIGQSLRDFLKMVEQEFPEEYVRIKLPVSREDITATVFELESSGKNPVVFFEDVKGFSHPIVTNIAGNRKLLAASLQVDPFDLPTVFKDRCQDYKPVIIEQNPPWEEVVFEGENVDLSQLPIPIHFPVDAAPYITAGQITARDPETGVDTTGFHRLMLNGKNKLGVSLHSRRRMYHFHKKAESRGESLPAAVAIGIHPIHYMGSMAYHFPPNIRKYEVIGGLFGEPYKVSSCSTNNLEVPFGAEIILEGEILVGVNEPEGPFGEFTGYASYRSTQNVFNVKKVQMRKDAIFHSIASGMSADHILISCVSREAEILNSLRRNLPNVKNVHVPSVTAGALLAIVSMEKTAEGQPQQAVMAALGTEFYCKCVVVVDDDVDIFNLSDVAWAIMTRTRAEKDIFFIPGAMGAILDPTSDPENHTLTKVGIDATKPKGKDFAERLFVSEQQKERVREILRSSGLQI